MQPGDFRNLLNPTVAEPRSLPTRNPSSLLLIQPTEQHVELPMIFAPSMVPSTARPTTTLLNHPGC
jgi:hypothetical protein